MASRTIYLLMDINHIELPAHVVANLYQSSLIADTESVAIERKIVSTDEQKQPDFSAADNTNPWKYLGNNQKNILVVVNTESAVYLSDQELNFLTGILTACKLSLADVSIVNHHQYPGSGYKELTNFFKSKISILFDLEPDRFGLPMSFPFYQIQAFAGTSFLHAPSLLQLENDKSEKTKLWTSLKRLFNL